MTARLFARNNKSRELTALYPSHCAFLPTSLLQRNIFRDCSCVLIYNCIGRLLATER